MGVRLRKDMFDYIKSGGSLNNLIEKITGENNNKIEQGITRFLSNGFLTRDKVDKDAVISAFIPFLFKDKRDILSKAISDLNK